MIPELGHFAIILALLFSIAQCILPAIGVLRNQRTLLAFAKPLTIGQSCFVFFGFIILLYAFIVHDFSVAYVANNDSTHLSLGYRIAALWSAHDGSLLLWITELSCWTLAFSFLIKRTHQKTLILSVSVLGFINTGFIIFLLFYCNPYARLLPFPPDQGLDINPLLQDPGMAIHPPMLYLGYVGFAIPFALTIAGLWREEINRDWGKQLVPWVFAPWAFLTFGITLGSWWAYRELGWGGYWFWDPVENASLLPWIAATALLHTLMVVKKQNSFKHLAIIFALSSFALSLIGTFIVRSGVLISVHAFAADPKKGIYLLHFLLLSIGLALLVYLIKAPRRKALQVFSFVSKESAILLNNGLLAIILFTILLGTLYPLFVQVLGYGKISVGPPYFNAVVIPLLFPLLFLMGVGPYCQWKSTKDAKHLLLKPMLWVLFLSLFFAFLTPYFLSYALHPMVCISLFLACWIILHTVNAIMLQWRLYASRKSIFVIQKLGFIFSHIGFAVMIIGIALSASYALHKTAIMKIGDQQRLGPYQFQLKKYVPVHGKNWRAVDAIVSVRQKGQLVTILKPQMRVYSISHFQISKVAIDTRLFSDIYVALGPAKGVRQTIRFYLKPFVRLIWLGGLLMFLGGILGVIIRLCFSGREQV